MKIKAIDDDFNLIVLSAFRYALGRMTYIPSVVVSFIKDNWGLLDRRAQETIHKEIKDAIERNEAGMDIDQQEWEKLLELPIIDLLKNALKELSEFEKKSKEVDIRVGKDSKHN